MLLDVLCYGKYERSKTQQAMLVPSRPSGPNLGRHHSRGSITTSSMS
jgi:hypothetical protein